MRIKIVIAVILITMLPVCWSNWGLTESSESRYAEISREMFVNGDYINPKLLGINHYHKPPVTYYITSLGYSIFGINEFGARFFPALSFLFQLLFVFKITDLLFKDKRISLAALLIYFSCPIGHIAAINLTTDSFLTSFIFATIYFYLKYRNAPRRIEFIYLFAMFCGLSFLTKGPVGILPSCLFAISYNWFSTQKIKFTRHHGIALLLGIVICSSWFVALFFSNPALLKYFLQHQIVDRVASDSFNRSKPFWYYFAFIPLLGLPTIFVLFNYLWDIFRRKETVARVNLVLLITLGICFLVFSISSSKLILYVLPLYLFIAILSAWHLSVLPKNKLLIFRNLFYWFYLGLFIVLLFAAFFSLKFYLPQGYIIASCVLAALLLSLLRFKVNLPLFISTALTGAAGMALLSWIFPVLLNVNELNINSVKPVASHINNSGNDSASIVVYDQLLPALAFYTNNDVITLHNGNDKTKRELQFEGAGSAYKKNYMVVKDPGTRANLQQLSEENIFVVVKQTDMLPDSLSFLTEKLPNKTYIGKWIIYQK